VSSAIAIQYDTLYPLSFQAAKKMAFFATAGEKGRIKLWRTDTGVCVCWRGVGVGVMGGWVDAVQKCVN
jgi:hypothetical protein